MVKTDRVFHFEYDNKAGMVKIVQDKYDIDFQNMENLLVAIELEEAKNEY